MRNLIHAMQLLTRLPMPKLPGTAKPAQGASWFPMAGLVIGLFLGAALWVGSRLNPWLGALLSLLVWVWITGALHLDGLADMSDALGAAHRNRERFLEILADPHLGTFGAVNLFLQLATKLILLMLLAKEGHFWALVLVPAWARLGPLFWARLPPLKSGMGERFGTEISPYAPWLWIFLLSLLSLPNPVLLCAPLGIWIWQEFLSRRMGGMTGDLLGAGIEVLESAFLLVLVGTTGFTATSNQLSTLFS